MDILNEGLRNKLTMEINGRLLNKFKVFNNFPIEFLSALAFLFQKRQYSYDEMIFFEEDESDFLCVITTGKVHLLHYREK